MLWHTVFPLAVRNDAPTSGGRILKAGANRAPPACDGTCRYHTHAATVLHRDSVASLCTAGARGIRRRPKANTIEPVVATHASFCTRDSRTPPRTRGANAGHFFVRARLVGLPLGVARGLDFLPEALAIFEPRFFSFLISSWIASSCSTRSSFFLSELRSTYMKCGSPTRAAPVATALSTASVVCTHTRPQRHSHHALGWLQARCCSKDAPRQQCTRTQAPPEGSLT